MTPAREQLLDQDAEFDGRECIRIIRDLLHDREHVPGAQASATTPA